MPSSAAAAKPSKFSPRFPIGFVADNAGIFAYFVGMIVLFELAIAPALTPLFQGGVHAIFFYAVRANVKSRQQKWLAANGNFPGDRAFLNGVASALLASAALFLWFTVEDYLE